ncbi:MerR family transcriptional regulator [Candidatus Enterococcus willemsii]|uniref:MerR family transcriptional regulator n=1 Tax=Candidatus Enterococcus willemsii TaxID=1857215 RepID=A0ABQ6Z052_9ENTE|nr:MerR family transcriptional regulator [Enterococcus sp. CU12B]KAF1304147.1 MerR family transcriptional regulator [Enterococcus sp. CU12B]
MKSSFLKELLDNDHLLVGISELSNMSSTSPRQLRYWEEKGFIASIEEETHGARRYRLPMVVKVELIKHYLDEGFTLKKAAEKADYRIKKVHHIRKVFSKSLRDIEIIDNRFTIFSLGTFEPNNERLVIIHDEADDSLHYHLFTPEETVNYEQLCQKLT